MIVTHIVLFNLLSGATGTPSAPDSFGGFVTHGGIYAFFSGFSPSDAGVVKQRIRGFVRNVGRLMNP